MPLYVGDYLADTGHLRTIDHGAYVLLIMHYWRTGGLPQQDAQLAAITRLPLDVWLESVKPVVQPLFKPGWRHKRLDYELERHEVIRTKRAIAGHKGGTAYRRHNPVHQKPNRNLPYPDTKLNDFNGCFEANAKQTGSSHSHIRSLEESQSEATPVDNVDNPQAAFEKVRVSSPQLEAIVRGKLK